MRLYPLIVAVFALASPVVEASTTDGYVKERLEIARAAWAESGLTDYSYTLERGGVFGPGPKRRVRVRDTTCVKVTYWWRLLRRQDDCDNRTIPELFDELEQVIQSDPSGIDVQFDPEFGYPVGVLVVPQTDIEDLVWWYRITRFHY
jgi:hypothetical protein